ncbi:hypothetical protein [Rubrivirga marina]|uniref:Uncharacterized protein n=1 Tax=Rubrivirga marina TaxID=1196024 RepID=A0A271IWE3_9BACT|nr:hypothetical protein [Rubrivirga marina]PAP75512.1 hypothetical protein BSZ37_03155 [Rubrivirga marina]
MPTCIWSHETSDRVVPLTLDVPSNTGGERTEQTLYVLPEHEAALRAYNERVARFGKTFLRAMLGLSAALLGVAVGAPLFGWPDATASAIVGLGVSGIGWLMIAFPFATPTTVRSLGIRRSIWIARGLGAVTVGLGIWIALAG